MGLHRVRHEWSDLAAAAAATCINHPLSYTNKYLWHDISLLLISAVFAEIKELQSALGEGVKAHDYILKQTIL